MCFLFDFVVAYISDMVVEEAAGEYSSGKSFRERNEDGFRESEVAFYQQLVDTCGGYEWGFQCVDIDWLIIK